MITQGNKIFIEHKFANRVEYSLHMRDGKFYEGKNITYRKCNICGKIIGDVWGCFERHLKTHK